MKSFLKIACFCLWSLHPMVSLSAQNNEIECYVEGSQDLLTINKDQKIYDSDTFEIYQLINGLSQMVINKQTRKFNRIVNLNLLKHSSLDPALPPEPIQILTGTCQ